RSSRVVQTDSYGANATLWWHDNLKSVEADPGALDNACRGELSLGRLSLQPSHNNQGEGERHDRILKLAEQLAKLVVFVWAINYGATGGYVRKSIAILALLTVLSGITWF